MCGITGCIIPAQSVSQENLTFWTRNATSALRHRGPDDGGVWIDSKAGIGLGHRRLSIIDVSSHGHQPMVSHDGRFVMTYNGEIYNFQELRSALEANSVPFRGHSDTEVLLAGIVNWGLEETLQRTNGMFALALWDRSRRSLHLARDRFGQKPLYYGWAGKFFIFGSSLAALRQYPDYQREIDRDAVALLLRHSNIPAPYTIYKNSWKLVPGTSLKLGENELNTQNLPEPKQYWSAERAALDASDKPIPTSSGEAIVDSLDTILKTAIRKCMVSDVPLGAFLSGGIDSSIVVSIMQTQAKNSVKTFTIGFTDTQYDEAQYANKIAQYLNTEHTDLYVTAQDAQRVIPKLPDIYDEPFADSSQIPTYLVSKLASQQVRVCLSGDGGDELFGGYNRYTWSRNLQLAINSVPLSIRAWGARNLRQVPPHFWDWIYSKTPPYAPQNSRLTQLGDKLYKLAEVIDASTKEEMYWRLISQWKYPEEVLLDAREYQTRTNQWDSWPAMSSFTQQMMMLDTIQYLPDDILVKLDRASMSVGLEARAPLLDHSVFEFAWALPEELKIQNGAGKWIVKKLLERYIPRHLFDRPKMGFGVPIGHWLRNDLREWAEDLLLSPKLTNDGFFQNDVVNRIWSEHLTGKKNHQHVLWPLLMFQAWLARYE